MINFPEEAQYFFDFLTTKYGFKCVSATAGNVRYESSDVFIEVNYDNINNTSERII